MMRCDTLIGMYWVYMVRCRDGSLYTGWTTDVAKRVAAHNAGRAAKYTRGRGPVRLVFTQKSSSRGKAMQREYALKQLSRQEKLTLIQTQGRA